MRILIFEFENRVGIAFCSKGRVCSTKKLEVVFFFLSHFFLICYYSRTRKMKLYYLKIYDRKSSKFLRNNRMTKK